MNFAPVGIKCPDHGAWARRADPQSATHGPQARRTIGGLEAPATVALVALNVLVYLVTVYQGGGVGAPGGELFNKGALIEAISVDGDWYRLVTAMFLHASLLHLASNMLALYWLGTIVEQVIGSFRFVLVYFASGLAGSAGALPSPIRLRPPSGPRGRSTGSWVRYSSSSTARPDRSRARRWASSR